MANFKNFVRSFYSRNKVARTLQRNTSHKQSSHPNYVYVLGCGYSFNPKTVFVGSGNTRVVFNCGPGTSRLLNEHRGKLRRLSAIFATRPTWENIGGLLTVALKLNDSKAKDCTVYNYPNLAKMLESSQNFLHLHHTKLLEGQDDFSDGNCTIVGVDLQPSRPLFNKEGSSESNSVNNELLPVKAYIMKSNPPAGQTVDIKKIVEKGVSPGLQLVNLLRGQSITLPNGKVVYPGDVTVSHKTNLVVVIECPSEDYFQSIENSDRFQQSYSDSNDCNTTVVHLSPSAVMKSPRYVSWMKKFSLSTIHLIVNDSNLVDGLMTLRYRQQLLSNIHPGIFPPLKEKGFYWLPAKQHLSKTDLRYNPEEPYIESDNPNSFQLEESGDETPVKGSKIWLSRWDLEKDLNICEGRPGTRIPFRPFGIERWGESLFDEFIYNEGFKSTLPKDLLDSIHQKFLNIGVDVTKPLKLQADYEKEYPRVIFLGTASKCESKDRNVTGILLRISEDSSIILDCGEGTRDQICRLYGEQAPEIFRSIDAIYVSHLHADHHMGLVDLIRERARAFGNIKPSPVILYASNYIRKWLRFLYNYFGRLDVIVIPLDSLLPEAVEVTGKNPIKSKDYVYSRTGFVKVQTVRVPHCHESYGVSVEHADGWKITYSGDCLFNDRLKQIGEGSDLLIHEATYDDSQEKLAIRNRHSTVSQALEAGRNMNAKFTILTHVSQRYTIMPSEVKSKDFSFALDFMQVPLRYCHHLPVLHELYNYVNEAFMNGDLAEQYEERQELLRNG